MVVMMSGFGRSLVTRAMGRAAYKSIAEQMASCAERTVFDFEGVDTITNSFADELFGRMALEMGMEELRARTGFRNIDPFWATVVRNAIDSRAAQHRELVAG